MVVALVLVLLQFVGNDEPTNQAMPSPQPTSTTSSTKPKPKPDKPGMWPQGLVVKIDNTSAARPHFGLKMADLVFVEPVEGGLTRMAAVYWGKRPGAIGPVRSARETDIQMLAQMRRPVVTFSGAAPELIPALVKAPFIRATPTTQPAAFYRAGARPSPHNLLVNPARLTKTKPVSSPLSFGAAPKGGKKTKSLGVSYQAASYNFRWSPRMKEWAITLDGRPLTSMGTGRVHAGTVVVQRVKVGSGQGVADTSGAGSPVAKTVGHGKATVLRDGKAYTAKWSRPNPKRETVYRIARNNKRLPFARGKVWVLFVPK
ncbi:MAG: DUF3048 domain-containing protein [Actinophytocola sp.]|nr:DUF3048 domain-containing protein [Actinophytocola sp.]